MFKQRLYKSGSKWAFWRWTFVQADHIVRLHIVKTPWFAVCLHWISKPDPEPDLHDHPVSFLSVILRGWYAEYFYRLDPPYTCVQGFQIHRWFNWIPATEDFRHKITFVPKKGCLTLCLMGPKTREWGFHTKDGWVYWKDYNKKYG